jgi:hypothetical protein
MKHACIAAIMTAVAAAPAASASVTAIITDGGVVTTFSGGQTRRTGENYASQLTDFYAVNASAGQNFPSYGNYQVVNDLQPDNIVFANNTTSAGRLVTVRAYTTLTVTFRNDDTVAVDPRLKSTITPGGFGLYVSSSGAHVGINPGDPSTPPGDINSNAAASAGFGFFRPIAADNVLGGSSFVLDISSGGESLAHYTGSLVVSLDPNGSTNDPGGFVPVATSVLTLGGLSATLNPTLVTPPDSTGAVGYQWNATDIEFSIPGGPLAVGESRSVTYATEVTSFTSSDYAGLQGCGGTNLQCPQLQAYSGFGDPIGRSSGPGQSPILDLSAIAQLDPGSAGDITGVTFPRFAFGLPTFDHGQLGMPLSPDRLPSLSLTPAPAPEPAAWSLMLIGLGAVGVGLRRRPARA